METASDHTSHTPGVWTLPLGDGGKLRLTADACSLLIIPAAEGTQPRLEAPPRLAGRMEVEVTSHGPDVHVELSRGMKNGRGFGFWEWGPPMEAVLHVPKAAQVFLQSHAGRVRVRDLQDCVLELESDAGVVHLEDVHGRLRLHSSAGRVLGERVGGTLDIMTHAGAVKLDVDRLDAGTHTIRTDMGSLKLDLTPDIRTRIMAHTTMGSVRVDHPDDRTAPAILDLSTELGSVRVRTRGKHPDAHDHHAHEHHGHEHFEHHGRRGRGRDGPPPVRPGAPWRSAGGGMGSVAVSSRPMETAEPSKEVMRVLEMVESGKLTAKEAQELLRSMGTL